MSDLNTLIPEPGRVTKTMRDQATKEKEEEHN
jgi:hypothetical protein